MEAFLTIIIWAAVVQGLLLGALFIASKKHQSYANRLLGCFLLAFVFAALSDLLPVEKIGNYSTSGYFTFPEVKLLLPVLFMHFVLEKLGRSRFYRLFLKIHYLFAFAIISLTLLNVLLVLVSGSSLLDLWGWRYLEPLHMGQQYYAFLFSVSALIIAVQETRRYRDLVHNEFTDIQLLEIKWLWQFILVIAPIILFWGAELLRIVLGGTGQSELTTVAYLFIAIFNYFVSYKAFTHHTLFEGTVQESRPPESQPEDPKSSQPVDQELCSRILNEMASGKYYLEPSLTIHDFARETKISARHISSCINQNTGSNFNEWVNHYRIHQAMELLKDPDYNHWSIEGIGIQSGFQSRSAMYAAFQRKFGKSPGHFR